MSVDQILTKLKVVCNNNFKIYHSFNKVFSKGFFQECFERELGLKKNDGTLKEVFDRKVADLQEKMQARLEDAKNNFENDLTLYKNMLLESQEKLNDLRAKAKKDLQVEKLMNEQKQKKLMRQEREMVLAQAKEERADLEEELEEWRAIEPVKAIQRERMSYFLLRWSMGAKVARLSGELNAAMKVIKEHGIDSQGSCNLQLDVDKMIRREFGEIMKHNSGAQASMFREKLIESQREALELYCQKNRLEIDLQQA